MKRLHRMLVLFAPGVIAGALIASTTVGQAQPRPPTPAPAPTPTPGPRRPTVVIKGDFELPPEARAQIRADLDRALADIDGNQDLPPKTRARLRRAIAKARASDMKDLTALGQALQEMSVELEGLGDELRAELPEIQLQVERALRRAGVARKAARLALTSPDGDPWAVVAGDDNDDEDADQDFDVDIDNGSVTIRRGSDPGTPVTPWARGWRGMTPPVPPVPPVPPAPPVPPLPPMPPGLDQDNAAMADPFDAHVGVDLRRRDSLAPAQIERLRDIATKASSDIQSAQRTIAAKSDELGALVASDDVDEARLDQLVDDIAREEAKLHKARLRALVQARRVLEGGH